jgi:uncharacterized protein (UPF0335 family)
MSEGNVAADQLRLFIERIERLRKRKKGIADDVKDVYAEAKANGYDTKTMRKIVGLRRWKARPRRSRRAARDLSQRARSALREAPWQAIPNSRTSCIARARRIRSARRCSPSSAAKSPSRRRWACPIPT